MFTDLKLHLLYGNASDDDDMFAVPAPAAKKVQVQAPFSYSVILKCFLFLYSCFALSFSF